LFHKLIRSSHKHKHMFDLIRNLITNESNEFDFVITNSISHKNHKSHHISLTRTHMKKSLTRTGACRARAVPHACPPAAAAPPAPEPATAPAPAGREAARPRAPPAQPTDCSHRWEKVLVLPCCRQGKLLRRLSTRTWATPPPRTWDDVAPSPALMRPVVSSPMTRACERRPWPEELRATAMAGYRQGACGGARPLLPSRHPFGELLDGGDQRPAAVPRTC
jgi:hypothetical protein